MVTSSEFLVIDVHPESRFLLVKTLLRKFPDSTIHETGDADEAVEKMCAVDLIAVVTHRTFDVPGVELVKRLREVNAHVPIIMVSGIDREEAALAAGADAFLHYDEWLRIGAVVQAVLEKKSRPTAEASDVA